MAIGTPVERLASAPGAISASTTAIHPASNVTAGTVLFLISSNNGSGKTISSVTDSQSNTWTVDKSEADAVRTVVICSGEMAVGLTTSDTVTIHWSNTNNASINGLWLEEVSGLATSAPFDTFAVGAATAFTAGCGPTGTLAQSAEIAWSAALHAAGTLNTNSSGFTAATTALQAGAAVEYQITAATTALSTSQGWSASGPYVALIATYLGGAATTPISDTETETGADAGESVAAALTDTDTGTGADAGESVAAALADADSASAADGGEAVAAGVVGSDTGTGADAGEAIGAALSDAEVGSAADAGESIAVHITDADIAAFLDAGEAVAANVTDADTATEVEAGTVVPTLFITDGDTAIFTDAGEHIGKPEPGLAGLTSPVRREGLTHPSIGNAGGDFMLNEDGTFMLNEDGSFMLLELA